MQLILEGAVHLDGDASDFLRREKRVLFLRPLPAPPAPAGRYLHLCLDPGADDVSLVGKLSAQTFVVLLARVFLDQSLVALRHQLPDLPHTIRHDLQPARSNKNKLVGPISPDRSRLLTHHRSPH